MTRVLLTVGWGTLGWDGVEGGQGTPGSAIPTAQLPLVSQPPSGPATAQGQHPGGKVTAAQGRRRWRGSPGPCRGSSHREGPQSAGTAPTGGTNPCPLSRRQPGAKPCASLLAAEAAAGEAPAASPKAPPGLIIPNIQFISLAGDDRAPLELLPAPILPRVCHAATPGQGNSRHQEGGRLLPATAEHGEPHPRVPVPIPVPHEGWQGVQGGHSVCSAPGSSWGGCSGGLGGEDHACVAAGWQGSLGSPPPAHAARRQPTPFDLPGRRQLSEIANSLPGWGLKSILKRGWARRNFAAKIAADSQPREGKGAPPHAGLSLQIRTHRQPRGAVLIINGKDFFSSLYSIKLI